MFQNAIGARVNVEPRAFPEETYDFGVREAVATIAPAAKPSAVIVSDAPTVVEHYLRGHRRPDVRVLSLSAHGIPVGVREAWVLVQDEHATFENWLVVEQLRARQKPWAQFHAGEALAVQVFRIAGRQP